MKRALWIFGPVFLVVVPVIWIFGPVLDVGPVSLIFEPVLVVELVFSILSLVLAAGAAEVEI